MTFLLKKICAINTRENEETQNKLAKDPPTATFEDGRT